MQLQGVLGLMWVVVPALSAPLLNSWNQPRFWNSYEDMSTEDYVLGYSNHNGPRSGPYGYWTRSLEDNSWEYGHHMPSYRPSLRSGSSPGISFGYGYDNSYEDYLEYQYLKQLLGAGKPRGVPSQRPNDKVPEAGKPRGVPSQRPNDKVPEAGKPRGAPSQPRSDKVPIIH